MSTDRLISGAFQLSAAEYKRICVLAPALVELPPALRTIALTILVRESISEERHRRQATLARVNAQHLS